VISVAKRFFSPNRITMSLLMASAKPISGLGPRGEDQDLGPTTDLADEGAEAEEEEQSHKSDRHLNLPAD
jgi:hypothetical protein